MRLLFFRVPHLLFDRELSNESSFLGEHMNNTPVRQKVICLILLGTILLTLLFIFGNSLASREESEELSDKVNASVGEVIETVTGNEESSLEDFFTKHHRKIAHFLEFAFLGLQIVLLLHFANQRSFSSLLAGALLSFAFAATDEGIQIFTGRGDQVSDIFIDAVGYLSAYFLTMLVLYLACWRKSRKMPASIMREKSVGALEKSM